MHRPILFFFFFSVIFSVTSCIALQKKKYVNETYTEIKNTFPNAQVSLLRDSIKVIFPHHLVFDIGKSEIKSTFNERLNRFSVIMKKFNKTNLLISGHSDNSGTENTNLKLSLKRAENVKKYLIERQINPKRLFTWGLGEKSPIASNKTKEGRSKNRRVEFVVLYKP